MPSLQILNTGRLDERESAFPQVVQLPNGDILCSFNVGGGQFVHGETDWVRSTDAAAPQVITPTPHPISDSSQPLRIVPQGLRSFDAHDADFVLELLPGPRDRDGLPDFVRFWKTRIEAQSVTEAFPVGLLYGPSG